MLRMLNSDDLKKINQTRGNLRFYSGNLVKVPSRSCAEHSLRCGNNGWRIYNHVSILGSAVLINLVSEERVYAPEHGAVMQRSLQTIRPHSSRFICTNISKVGSSPPPH